MKTILKIFKSRTTYPIKIEIFHSENTEYSDEMAMCAFGFYAIEERRAPMVESETGCLFQFH